MADTRLVILSLSDIVGLPVLGTCCDGLYNIGEVAVGGSYAYEHDYREGLAVVDISDPSNPAEVGRFPLSGWLGGAVAVSGHHVFYTVSDGSNRLRVLDVVDPSHPALLTSCQMPANSGRVVPSGDYIYAPNRDAGLGILHLNIERHAVYLPLIASGD